MPLILSDLLGTLRNTWRVALGTWNTAGLTAARTWTMPDKDGTVAMTSDITGGALAAPVTLTSSTTLTRASHGNRLVLVNSASNLTMTIGTDATGGWQDGDVLIIRRIGTGAVSIAASSTTINRGSPYQASVRYQHSQVVLVRTAANVWGLSGELSI